MASAAIQHAREHRQASLDNLLELLRIPSVSAVPEQAGEVRRAAEWVAARMRAVGLGHVRVDPTPGHPIVYGERIVDPAAPTVLVYGHYDVQPAEPLERWESPPFEPTIRDGSVFARGSSDDKGQFIAYLEALGAFQATQGGPPVNVRLVIEGEEEVGSPSLDGWLEAHAGELSADVALISDSAMVAPGIPSIVYGLRGLAYLEVHVRGPRRDLHSGQFGGAVLNPVRALAMMLAGLHDDRGRVTVPGFYDRVRPLADDERAELARVPFDVASFQGATGDAGYWGEEGYSVVERLGARPTLDVNGIWAGWTGAGAKTVIPAEAHAKVSMRLVPDQDPDDVAARFTEHMQSAAPRGIEVTVERLHGAQPVLVPRDGAAMAAASRAFETVFGRAPVFTREGGSIPVVATLKSILGVDTVLMGFGLQDDNLHAPNEKYAVENYHRGIETIIALFEDLGAPSA